MRALPMLGRSLLLLTLGVALPTVTACGSSNSSRDRRAERIEVVSIVITPPEATIDEGDEQVFTLDEIQVRIDEGSTQSFDESDLAELEDNEELTDDEKDLIVAALESLEWSSSEPLVASVEKDARGDNVAPLSATASGLSGGVATITVAARAGDAGSITASAELTVVGGTGNEGDAGGPDDDDDDDDDMPDAGEPEPEPDAGEPEPEPEPDAGEPEPEPDAGPGPVDGGGDMPDAEPPAPENQAPSVENDTETVPEDDEVSFSLEGTDPEDDALTFEIVTEPSNGELVLDGDTVTYTPAPNYSGPDSFEYLANDGELDSNIAVVALTVTAVNDAPTAEDDAFTVAEGATFDSDFSLLENDNDVDGDVLMVSPTPASAPSSGAVVLNADGSFSYTADADGAGTDTFSYEACDPEGLCAIATVTVTITAVNEAPSAQDDTYNVAQGATLNIANPGVLNNDSDPDGDTLTASVLTNPAAGALTFNPQGGFNYVHNGVNSVNDSFTYEACDPSGACDQATVTLIVTDQNNPPQAVADAFTLEEGALFDSSPASVLDNDSDPEGPVSLGIAPVTAPVNGVLTISADGTFTYQHDGSETTEDAFTYEACDGSGACSVATVQLDITPVNEPAELLDDTVTVGEGMSVSGSVLDNDTDPDEGDLLMTTVASPPSNGSVTLDQVGNFTYTHDGSETIADSFLYEACDTGGLCGTATVTINVAPVNDAPVAVDDSFSATEGQAFTTTLSVLANDTDAEGDALVVSTTPVTLPTAGTVALNASGTFTYTPTSGASSDSFVYEVCDPSADCDTAQVNIGFFNSAPIAVDDSTSVAENGGVVINVLANDSDPGGDALTVQSALLVQPVVGNATVGSNGLITYNHVGGQTEPAADSFVYEICDTENACAAATVTVTIVYDPDPVLLVAEDDTFDDLVGHRLLLGNVFEDNGSGVDTGPNGFIACPVQEASTELDGLFSLNENGDFAYLPPINTRATQDFAGYQLARQIEDCVAEPDVEPGDEPFGDMVFTIGTNIVWHVDPNNFGENTDGRQFFPTDPSDPDATAVSYGFSALDDLNLVITELNDVLPGDIVAIYADANPPIVQEERGITLGPLEASLELPQGVAVIGEGTTLSVNGDDMLAPFDFPEIDFPDAALATGQTPLLSNVVVLISIDGLAAVGFPLFDIDPGLNGPTEQPTVFGGLDLSVQAAGAIVTSSSLRGQVVRGQSASGWIQGVFIQETNIRAVDVPDLGQVFTFSPEHAGLVDLSQVNWVYWAPGTVIDAHTDTDYILRGFSLDSVGVIDFEGENGCSAPSPHIQSTSDGVTLTGIGQANLAGFRVDVNDIRDGNEVGGVQIASFSDVIIDDVAVNGHNETGIELLQSSPAGIATVRNSCVTEPGFSGTPAILADALSGYLCSDVVNNQADGSTPASTGFTLDVVLAESDADHELVGDDQSGTLSPEEVLIATNDLASDGAEANNVDVVTQCRVPRSACFPTLCGQGCNGADPSCGNCLSIWSDSVAAPGCSDEVNQYLGCIDNEVRSGRTELCFGITGPLETGPVDAACQNQFDAMELCYQLIPQ